MAEFLPDAFSHSFGWRPQIPLSGRWSFRRDPGGRGRTEGWHEGRGTFPRQVVVPGAPQAQGVGEPTHRMRAFFLEPFWVRRSFALPALAAGQRVRLRLGGVLPAADLYLNGRHLGYTRAPAPSSAST